jgi:predicted ATP-dependent serine protease
MDTINNYECTQCGSILSFNELDWGQCYACGQYIDEPVEEADDFFDDLDDAELLSEEN